MEMREFVDLERLVRAVENLPAINSEIMRLWYGIGYETYSVEEIARIFKMTQARIHQKRDRSIDLICLAIGDERVTPKTLPMYLEAAGLRTKSQPKEHAMQMVEFVELVAAMRDARRDYFNVRTPKKLAICKRLEREVDAAVKELQSESKQPLLF